MSAVFASKATIFRRGFAVAAAAIGLFPSYMAGQEQRPKITSPILCGEVTDLAGSPIAKANVAAMWADFGTSLTTDQLGRWSFGAGTGPHWMQVEADGYETFIFDYVDGTDRKDKGANKPAFIVRPRNKGCPVPIYVRLAPKGLQAGSVSLKRTLTRSKP